MACDFTVSDREMIACTDVVDTEDETGKFMAMQYVAVS